LVKLLAVTERGAGVTLNEPPPLALSAPPAPVAPLAVNATAPAGVLPAVVMVRVVVLDPSAGTNGTGFGEKLAEAPAGNAEVMLMVAEKAPEDPEPLPRLTVTV
jgi:hypothetical protein